MSSDSILPITTNALMRRGQVSFDTLLYNRVCHVFTYGNRSIRAKPYRFVVHVGHINPGVLLLL